MNFREKLESWKEGFCSLRMESGASVLFILPMQNENDAKNFNEKHRTGMGKFGRITEIGEDYVMVSFPGFMGPKSTIVPLSQLIVSEVYKD